uniref:Sulfotransferase n=1 Tax=Tetraselmis sp. GSL018 TaxID=582737 RepID=A0A061S2P1_9CHLO
MKANRDFLFKCTATETWLVICIGIKLATAQVTYSTTGSSLYANYGTVQPLLNLSSLLDEALMVDYASLPPVLDTVFSGDCRLRRISARSLRDDVVVSDTLKVVYVANLKAGYMAIKTYLRAYGKVRKVTRITLPTILDWIQKGYKIFTFVRDPLTRLRSAYSETLYHSLSKPERNHVKKFTKTKPSLPHLKSFVKNLRCCRNKFVKEIYHADAQQLFIGSGVSERLFRIN